MAVADRQRERADEFAAITNVASAYDNARDLFANPELNTVYVCTETAEHPALVIEAARRGMHVFCEKPLATSLDRVEEMVAAVQEAGIVHQVGLILRSSPVLTVFHHLISDPGLGRLLTAHLRDDQYFPVNGLYNSRWRGDVDKAGGGTLIEHSIHDVDIFRWFFGEVRAVRCHTRNVTGHPGVEDVAIVTFQHTNGASTTLSSVWHDIDGRASTRRLEVFLERGWFATDHDFLGPIEVHLNGETPRVLTTEEVLDRFCALRGLNEEERTLAENGMLADYQFVRSVSREEAAFPGFEEAYAAHLIVDACYRSATEGLEIEIGKA